MELVQGMMAFVRAAETRSFTHAAKDLGMTSSGIGKTIARLEAELGVRLLYRTTRRVALTDDGAVFLEHCRRVIEEVELARASLADRGSTPRGRLRVSMPNFLATEVVVPALAAFTTAHPDVSLDLGMTDRKVNLVEDGIDLALRVGHLHDSSLVARRLGVVHLVTIAAPSLVARAPLATLGDLAVAPCVAFRQPTTGRERPWSFAIDGRAVEWSPRAAVVLDAGDAMVTAAAAGIGVTQVPDRTARAALASGAVVEVLEGLRAAPLPVHAIYVASRKLPPRTRAFLSFLAALPAWAPQPRGRAAQRRRIRP